MIGEHFGNYQAVSLLGEGGMGAVYLAEHKGIGRRVAVKVLHKSYVRDEQLLARFLNEARAANAIRHPNIIEILDSGTIADGTPFLVMELLEGESLGSRLRRVGALPVAVAVDFAYQTASALGAAHTKGIVHRDLKPDNLFIVSDPHDPTRERIKVLDFGIAKLHQSGGTDSVKTRTGTLMGTPLYMSPEQCRGTKAIDHRSDIYSLGIIFYEMLTGQPPFVSEGFGDLVNMHLNVAAAPARTLRPEIPPAIDAVVLKTLAKSPDERFADMTELQAALKASGMALASSPNLGTTRPPTAPPDAAPRPGETTFSTGVGEMDFPPPARGGRGKLIAGVTVIAAAAAGYVFFARGDHGLALPGTAAVSGPPSAPAKPPPQAPPVTPDPAPAIEAPKPAATPPPEAKSISVHVTTNPAGAHVVDDDGGAVLGVTPLVLTRPRGGVLSLRIEKDGYTPSTRKIALDDDQTLELTLEHKPKPHPHKTKERDDEPAKL